MVHRFKHSGSCSQADASEENRDVLNIVARRERLMSKSSGYAGRGYTTLSVYVAAWLLYDDPVLNICNSVARDFSCTDALCSSGPKITIDVAEHIADENGEELARNIKIRRLVATRSWLGRRKCIGLMPRPSKSVGIQYVGNPDTLIKSIA